MAHLMVADLIADRLSSAISCPQAAERCAVRSASGPGLPE